jgi:hypothetical protein
MILLKLTEILGAVKSVLNGTSYLVVAVAAWLPLLLVGAIALNGIASAWAPAWTARADTATRRRSGPSAGGPA